MQYFLDISYKGTNYHGWQSQHNALGIQTVVEKALSTLLREEITIIGSGRTDTGVHATQQLVQFTTDQQLTSYRHIIKINALLPDDIVAKKLYIVPDEAHSRYDAVSRSYEYRIIREKSPFYREMAYFFYKDLDIVKLNEASKILLRHTDFESFSRVHTDVTSFLCTITEARWEYRGEVLIFHITANRFLRGMVRTIVGTLIEIGLGRMTEAEFELIIASRDRKKAGRAAPADGLFLTKVIYPEGHLQAV